MGARKQRSTSSRRKARRNAPDRLSTPLRRRERPWLLPALLVALTFAAFLPVLRNGFVNYDDPEYVVSNAVVRDGLTWKGVQWAFTTGRAANWHPLTWLSHMADVSLFDLDAPGHHATSVLFHAMATLLLYLLLRGMTGKTGESAFVAALFAVHPAHVESVAWVAERKDVLSAVFWFATLLAYAAWVRKPGAGRYTLILVLFAAGLMSKPMLVSLPLTLLLLDYWPLERWRQTRQMPGLLVEKIPLLLMAAGSSAVTLIVQAAGGAVRTAEHPLGARLANAGVSFVRYLRMLLAPHLAVFYPYDADRISVAAVAGAALLLIAISAAAIALRRRAPYVFVGWFWFVVTLLPVIGLVQVGEQAIADRYTYVPFVGLFVAIAWGVSSLAALWRHGRLALRAASVVVLVALAAATSARVRVWKDSETLFLDALEKTRDNYLAHLNLGHFFIESGRTDEALGHFREAERIRPDEPEVQVGLGYALLLLGRQEDAARSFERALRFEPRHSVALNNLARIRFLDGDVSESVRLYRATVAAKPDWAEGHRRLGIGLLMQGETGPALGELERALMLDPSDREARSLLDGVRMLGRAGDPSADALRAFLADAHRQAAAALRRRGLSEQAANEESRAQSLSIPAR